MALQQISFKAPKLEASDAGKNLTLFVYAVANDIEYYCMVITSDAIALKAVDKTEEMKNIAFNDDFALTMMEIRKQ